MTETIKPPLANSTKSDLAKDEQEGFFLRIAPRIRLLVGKKRHCSVLVETTQTPIYEDTGKGTAATITVRATISYTIDDVKVGEARKFNNKLVDNFKRNEIFGEDRVVLLHNPRAHAGNPHEQYVGESEITGLLGLEGEPNPRDKSFSFNFRLQGGKKQRED